MATGKVLLARTTPGVLAFDKEGPAAPVHPEGFATARPAYQPG